MNEYKKALKILEIDDDGIKIKDVKAKYHKLIMRYHPDAYNGEDIDDAINKTQQLNWAYTVLRIQSRNPEDILKSDNLANNSDVLSDFASEFVKNKVTKDMSAEEIDKLIRDLMDDLFSCASAWEGKPENKNATIKRAEGLGFPGGYYYWDPIYDPWENFTGSIDGGIRHRFNRIIKDELGVNMSNKQSFSYTFMTSLYRNTVYSLAQDEYVRPYYCLGKQIEDYQNMVKKIGVASDELIIWHEPEEQDDRYNKKDLQKNPYEFQEASLVVCLEMPSVGKRTETIESLKIGDELQLFVNPFHTEYSDEIEVFTNDFRSVGRLPIPLCITIGRLIAGGKLITKTTVKHIETRAMRGPRARAAYATVDLYLRVIPPIDDVVVDNSRAIRFYETEIIKMVKKQKSIIDDVAGKKDKDSFLNDYIDKNYKSEKKGAYDKLIYFDYLCMKDRKKDPGRPSRRAKTDISFFALPDGLLDVFFTTIEAISNRTVIDKHIDEENVLRFDYSDKYSIEVMFVDNGDRQESYIYVYEKQLMLEAE